MVTTLVSDVATAYLTLRELDYELEISQRTLQTRQESLELTKSRQTGGVATLLDLRQAEQLVDTAAQTIPVIQQQIEQTENQINLLLGRIPATCRADASLTEQELPPEVPAGLPSALLERRPDIRAAEQDLDRRQRQDRRGQGGLLPANESERIPGRAEHATVEPVQRAAQRLELSCRSSRSRSSPRDV